MWGDSNVIIVILDIIILGKTMLLYNIRNVLYQTKNNYVIIILDIIILGKAMLLYDNSYVLLEKAQ